MVEIVSVQWCIHHQATCGGMGCGGSECCGDSLSLAGEVTIARAVPLENFSLSANWICWDNNRSHMYLAHPNITMILVTDTGIYHRDSTLHENMAGRIGFRIMIHD